MCHSAILAYNLGLFLPHVMQTRPRTLMLCGDKKVKTANVGQFLK